MPSEKLYQIRKTKPIKVQVFSKSGELFREEFVFVGLESGSSNRITVRL